MRSDEALPDQLSPQPERFQAGGTPAVKPPRWVIAVSAVLVIWLAAQAYAGVKFLNGQTYPVVGSAMFNSPPSGGSDHYMVPRIFATTKTGKVLEMDERTFSLEAFEWRRWQQRDVENADRRKAERSMRELARLFEQKTGVDVVAMEMWRIQARTDDRSKGHLVARFEV